MRQVRQGGVGKIPKSDPRKGFRVKGRDKLKISFQFQSVTVDTNWPLERR